MKTGVKRTGFGILVCLGVIGFGGCRRSTGKTRIEKPVNLVVIVSDALRRDVLGCYGGAAHTPNIDRLAREGTMFDNAYSTAPCTMPSSVAMLTGNYSRTYSYYHRKKRPGRANYVPMEYYCFYVPDAESLLAESLNAKGWISRAAIGNSVVKRSNILQGFSLLSGKMKDWKERSGDLSKRMGLSVRGGSYRHILPIGEFLLSLPGKQSFFLLDWIIDPHAPYASVPEKGRDIALMEKNLPHPPEYYTSKRCSVLQKLIRAGSLSEVEMEYIRCRYHAEVESVDERVGHILKILESRGWLEETLIVFTSDHGELLGEHDRIGHGRGFFQELVRVPLIFRGPGVPSGKRISPVVTHLGLTPTLAELCGAPIQECMGRSYSALFVREGKGESMAYFDAVSNNLDPTLAGRDAILRGEFKLIINRKAKRKKVLFDLEREPGEDVDRTIDFPDQVQTLSREIARVRAVIRQRLEQNASRLKGSLDLDDAARKARETLKSLGYL